MGGRFRGDFWAPWVILSRLSQSQNFISFWSILSRFVSCAGQKWAKVEFSSEVNSEVIFELPGSFWVIWDQVKISFHFPRIFVYFRQIWNRWPHRSGIAFSKTKVAMQNPKMSLVMVSGFSFLKFSFSRFLVASTKGRESWIFIPAQNQSDFWTPCVIPSHLGPSQNFRFFPRKMVRFWTVGPTEKFI